MKTCPACNRQNPADALICSSCGERLGIESGWEKTRIRTLQSGDFAPGSSIADRYETVKEIGRGGMGVVYLTQDMWLEGRQMALKMIHPELVELPEARQRFKQEVNTCLDLMHTNIVRVHNLEEWEGLQFFTMEYVGGQSLQTLIAQRKPKKPPFTLSETAAVIIPLLDALSYAHQHTIHRDIKPDNIVVIAEFPRSK
jgi:serine/threonine protein kinase